MVDISSFQIFNITHNSFQWNATLSNPFNTSFYISICLSTGTTTNGSTTQPPGIVAAQNATAGHASTTTPTFTQSSNVTPNTTSTLNCYVRASNNTFWRVGSGAITFTTPPAPDTTPPTLSISSRSVTNNSITLNWTSSDAHSGLSGHWAHISAPNGETLVSIGHTLSADTKTHRFTRDANGNNLIANTRYRVNVQAFDVAGNTSPVLFEYVTTAPAPVANLVVTARTATSITISWTASTGATSYEIAHGIPPLVGSPVNIGNVTSHTFSGLTASTTYNLTVVAVNTHGRTANTIQSSTTTAVPSTPTLVNSHGSTSTEIYTQWSSSGATHFEVSHRQKGTLNWTVRALTTSAETWIGNLIPSTTYEVRCRGSNSVGFSSHSIIHDVTTLVHTVPVLESGHATDSFSIFTRWTAFTSATYELRYRVINTASWITMAQVTSREITIPNLVANTDYEIQCRAFYGGHWTTFSATSTRRTAPAPPTLSATVPSVGQVRLSWNAPVNATVYEVQFKQTRFADYTVHSNSISLTNVTIINLDSLQSYDFRVRTRDTSNWGSWSNVISITPALNPRPSNWAWHTTKVSGELFNLTATEWNSFTSRINGFRTYRNLTTTTFTSAVSGGIFTAVIFNQARDSINGMTPPIAVPATQTAGNNINASLLNGLRDSLNSIL